MHVPTPSRRCRTTRSSRYIPIFPPFLSLCLNLFYRNALPNHSSRRSRCSSRTLQTHRSIRRIKHVSWSTQSFGERSKTTIFDQIIRRRSNKTECMNCFHIMKHSYSNPFFPTEIQDQDRRSTKEETHGILRRCNTSRYHEKPRRFLDFKG